MEYALGMLVWLFFKFWIGILKITYYITLYPFKKIKWHYWPIVIAIDFLIWSTVIIWIGHQGEIGSPFHFFTWKNYLNPHKDPWGVSIFSILISCAIINFGFYFFQVKKQYFVWAAVKEENFFKFCLISPLIKNYSNHYNSEIEGKPYESS